MQQRMYKCPYCLFPFNKDEVKREFAHNDVQIYYCPNTQINGETGRELCGRPLPDGFMRATSKVIALTGGSAVGKTTYCLALLIQLMANKWLQSLGISGELIGDEESVTRINSLLADLIDKTAPLKSNKKIADKSILIKIEIIDSKSIQQIYLSLFDNPGEVIKEINHKNNDYKSIVNADGVLFLFDPDQLQHLRAQSNGRRYGHSDLYRSLLNMFQILAQRKADNQPETTLTLIRKLLSMKDSSQIPIGMVLSKIDQILDLYPMYIPDDFLQLGAHIREGRFANKVIDDISMQIETSILRSPDADKRVIDIISNHTSTYKIFGVKSINYDFENQEVIDAVSHRGVLLPLLWLLKELEILKLYED